METRLVIAYSLIAFMVLAAAAVWVLITRKRRRNREIMRGRFRRKPSALSDLAIMGLMRCPSRKRRASLPISCNHFSIISALC